MRAALYLSCFVFFASITGELNNNLHKNPTEGKHKSFHDSLSFKQDTTGFNYIPHFFAVIVDKLDTAEKWYCSVFQLKTTKHINETATGFRVCILESSKLVVELIENKSFLSVKNILANKPEETKIQGLFKAGFLVTDMNACLKRLAALSIATSQIYKDAKGKRNFLISDPDGNLIQFFE